MSETSGDWKNQFVYPRSGYRGKFTPENLAFNANLQEFAQRVNFVCNLETGGKISPIEAYQRIKNLWKELEQSKIELLDTPKPLPPEAPSE